MILYFKNHWCPVKNQRFFALFRMTAIYKCMEEGRVGLRRSLKPTLPSSHNSLIVISNEVRNLSITCIEMILPDHSVQEYKSTLISKKMVFGDYSF